MTAPDHERDGRQLAGIILSHRKRLGPHWRKWAENEVRKRPELEPAARAELNRLMGKAG